MIRRVSDAEFVAWCAASNGWVEDPDTKDRKWETADDAILACLEHLKLTARSIGQRQALLLLSLNADCSDPTISDLQAPLTEAEPTMAREVFDLLGRLQSDLDALWEAHHTKGEEGFHGPEPEVSR